MEAEAQNIRRFQVRARSHNAANSGSEGHDCAALYANQAEMTSNTPEMPKIQPLCSARVTRNGTLLVTAATVAPRPSITRPIGNAQQSSVPDDANKLSHVMRFVLTSVVIRVAYDLEPTLGQAVFLCLEYACDIADRNEARQQFEL